MVFDASDFTKLENKTQPASKNDEATVKPAEIEVSVPERTPRFLQRESEVCEGLGASLCKDLLKAPALHLAMIFSKPLRPFGAAADGSQQSQSGSRAGRLFFM